MNPKEYAEELKEILNLKVSAGLTGASLAFIEDCVKAVLRDERQNILDLVKNKSKPPEYDPTIAWNRGYRQACVEILVYIQQRMSDDT